MHLHEFLLLVRWEDLESALILGRPTHVALTRCSCELLETAHNVTGTENLLLPALDVFVRASRG